MHRREKYVEKHISTDHYKIYVKALDGMLEEKVVHKMARIES
jgi:quinol monooxygenase YgiN